LRKEKIEEGGVAELGKYRGYTRGYRKMQRSQSTEKDTRRGRTWAKINFCYNILENVN